MQVTKYLSLYLILLAVFATCTPQKEVVKKKPTGNKNPYFLIEQLKKNEVKCDWLTLKASVDVTVDGKKSSFRANVRMRNDSIVWVSISPLFGLEAARVLVSRDSVKMINRLSSNYFEGNYYYLNSMFHTDLSYSIIQTIMLGNSIGLDEVEKPKSSAGKGYYLLSSLKKRKLRKAMQKDNKVADLVYSHWLDPQTYRIKKVSVYDFKTNRSFNCQFEDHKNIDGQYFPHKVRLSIKADQNIEVELSYSKITLNKLTKFSFKVPERFEKID